MNSEQNSNPTSSNTEASVLRPQARDILRTLETGDDPMDFIQKNLAKLQPEVEHHPEQVIKDVEAKRAAEQQEDSSVDADGFEVPVPDVMAHTAQSTQQPDLDNQQSEEVQDGGDTEQIPTEEESAVDGEEPGEGEDETNTTAENFKRLRGVVREAKKTISDRDKQVVELSRKLRKYESGEEHPNIVQELQERVNQLERYEQLMSLKTSPQYKEKFIRPLTEIKERLTEIAKDYEIPSEIMNEAMELDNRAELNRFLSSHFDEIGALEVKQLVTQARDLEKQAKEAEKEPQNALERILQDADIAREERRRGELAVMGQTSKDAWIDSLIRIREEGDVSELIHREGDTEYNQKFVNPIIKKAATEYGKIVSILSENGLEKLPKDLAFALARMCQLAHASAVALHTRNNAVKYAEELENNVKRSTSYIRPQIGATNGGGQSSQKSGLQPLTPAEAASKLLDSVLPGR